MEQTRKCPDCGGEMELGFIPDATYGAVLQSKWHKGPTKAAKFFGLDAGVKLSSFGLIPIEAYRCTQCWLVRSYAPPPAPQKG